MSGETVSIPDSPPISGGCKSIPNSTSQSVPMNPSSSPASPSLIEFVLIRSNLLKELFCEAVDLFKKELSKDPSKWQWIVDSKAGTLSEILSAITAEKTKYEARREKSITRKALADLSERIHHYGNIMDVLVQHHPEYTSLAWGAMKVLFVVS